MYSITQEIGQGQISQKWKKNNYRYPVTNHSMTKVTFSLTKVVLVTNVREIRGEERNLYKHKLEKAYITNAHKHTHTHTQVLQTKRKGERYKK